MSLAEHNADVISRHDRYLTGGPGDWGEDTGDESEGRGKHDVPGIDDCDLLFTMSSKNGQDNVYICCQQFDDGIWANGILDVGSYCDSPLQEQGPFKTFDDAFWGCAGLFDWFADNGIRGYWCNNSKRVIRRARDRARAAIRKTKRG
jgi:hypothetical protein